MDKQIMENQGGTINSFLYILFPYVNLIIYSAVICQKQTNTKTNENKPIENEWGSIDNE